VRLAAPALGDDELTAVGEVFASGILTDGPRTALFEQAFATAHDAPHAVAFSSGTVALCATYLALGVGPGDEVIVPSLTFISTATSVVHAGATPVFADVAPDTFCLDPTDVARRITPRTKAIVPVHYGGQPADLDELGALADDAGVALVEDAAEAHGATYKGRAVGTHGRAAMFSFTPTKNMTTGEGGMVTTTDAALADRLRLLRNHGMRRPGGAAVAMVGFNWRMSEVHAAIGLVQLGRLPDRLDRRRRDAAALTAALADAPGVCTPATRADRDHTFMLYSLELDDRDEVRSALAEVGVESRLYFPPAHLEAVLPHDDHPLPVTEHLAERLLSVPLHAASDEQMLSVLSRAGRPATVR